MVDQVCSGVTRRGTACKLKARPGHTTCRIHGGLICPVCLDAIDPSHSRTLECQHTFHVRCLERWKRIARTCPMCRIPFDQPQYKVRVSIQRLSDSYVSSNTYITSNVDGLVNTFGIDSFTSPRFVTDILFEIGFEETLTEVFNELGLNMPSEPYEPSQVQPGQPHI
jgi:hypothetical protein